MKAHSTYLTCLTHLTLLTLATTSAFAQGTAFDYQGRLTDNGSPATGLYDFQFRLFAEGSGGAAIASPNFLAPVPVTNGLFNVTLNFGAGMFAGADRWLEVAVRTHGSDAPRVTLTPRQRLLPMPYAIHAASAGAFTGDADLTAERLKVGSGHLLSGAFATIAGGLDNTNLAPYAVIGSGRYNLIESDAPHAVIGGGFGNVIQRDNDEATIGGGHLNTIASYAESPTIAGGRKNIINSNAHFAVIGGGVFNSIQPRAESSTIAGGRGNTIQADAAYATISGGYSSSIESNAWYATISGGWGNTNGSGAYYSAIGGGLQNLVDRNAQVSAIGGGSHNVINPGAGASTIAGGASNAVGPGAFFATVLGGERNEANASRALSAGYRAKANHFASFVWADGSSDTDFASTTRNQFSLRADGGVRIETGVAGMTLNGQNVLAGTVSGAQLADGSITASKLAANSVTSGAIAAGAVNTADLANGAVTANHLSMQGEWGLPTTINSPTHEAFGAFGSSVAFVGTDKILIGASGDNGYAGAAYLFSIDGRLLTGFTSPSPTPGVGDNFGVAVAALGPDKVVIGAPYDKQGLLFPPGAAYLFDLQGNLLARFRRPNPAHGFGRSVAAVGVDKVLVGASQDDTGATWAGAAYLFRTNGTLLTTFTNPTPAFGDGFGVSVAAVGADMVVIGAHGDDGGVGAAYLFTLDGTRITTFNNPTPAADDNFGIEVARLGGEGDKHDAVIIGAYRDDDSGFNNAGAAYLFSTNGNWLTTFTNPTPAIDDGFGIRVTSPSPQRILVGSAGDDTGALNSGSAYLFDFSGAHLATFTNPAPAVLDGFGGRIAALGTDKIVIAVPSADGAGVTNAGKAYLFRFGSYMPGLVSEGVRPSFYADLARLSAHQTFTGVNIFGERVGVGTPNPQSALDVTGELIVRNPAASSEGGKISALAPNGTRTVEIVAAEAPGEGAFINLFNGNGARTIKFDGHDTGGRPTITLHKSDTGVATITLDADNGGDGTITTQVLQITGGSDLSERFEIPAPGGAVESGMVVCIDPANPGKLVLSSKAHDRTVAGVISGAGGVKPGMLMGQAGSVADGQHPVALTGRVYAWADASKGPIQPGDLLTTSDTPGHAMRVTDHALAQGAIIGKAMTHLATGKGLVLVLVSLQ